MNALTLALAAVLALTVNVASAGVIRVDAAGGGDHTSLQAAIDASTAGDILLVKPGTYVSVGMPAFLVAGKGITITADPPLSTFVLNARIAIESVPAGQTAIVRGATTISTYPAGAVQSPGILVTKCFGSVLVEDCVGLGAYGVGFGGLAIPGSPGITVEYCAAVSIVRSTGVGGVGANACFCGAVGSSPASAGGPGLRVYASKVALHDCAFTGGSGGWPSGPFAAGAGGFGGFIETAFVFGSGCSFAGATPNGNGLGINVPIAPVRFLDSTFVSSGLGAAVLDPANALQTVPGTARHFIVSSPVREHFPAAFQLDGEPGDVAILFIGFGIDAIDLSGLVGPLQMSLPLQGPFVLGTLPAPDGVLSFSVPAPDLVVPGLLGFTSILQPIVVSGTAAYAAPPSSFVLVDSSL